MDYDLLIEKAINRGIKNVEIFKSREVDDLIQTFNNAVMKIETSDLEIVNINCLIDNKKVSMKLENLEEDIDEIIDELIENSKVIDSEDVNVFCSNDKKYPVKKIVPFDIDNSKFRKELFEINNKVKSIDKRILNTEFELCFNYLEINIMNDLGLNVEQRNQICFYYTEITCEFEGKQYVEHKHIHAKTKNEIDMFNIASACAIECLNKIGGNPIDTGDYEIILSKRVVAGLLSSMTPAFLAENVNKEKSVLKGKLNQKIVFEKLTLLEDPASENYVDFRYFDDEGVETKYKEIIKNGVLQTYLYDLKNARKDNVESTGNGYIDSKYCNLFFKPGENSVEEMIKSTDNGIFVTEIQGLHSGLNSVNGDFSLQISGKYIESGVVMSPVTLMIISGNYFDMLNDVTMIGDVVDFNVASVNIGGTALKIKSLTVSGK